MHWIEDNEAGRLVSMVVAMSFWSGFGICSGNLLLGGLGLFLGILLLGWLSLILLGMLRVAKKQNRSELNYCSVDLVVLEDIFNDSLVAIMISDKSSHISSWVGCHTLTCSGLWLLCVWTISVSVLLMVPAENSPEQCIKSTAYVFLLWSSG